MSGIMSSGGNIGGLSLHLFPCLGLSSYMFFSNGKMDDSDDINEETTKVRTHTLAQHAWILVLSAQLFFRETKHI